MPCAKTLSPLETFALAKAVKDKQRDAARDQLAIGAHEVDVTVRIRGPVLIPGDVPATEKEDVEPRRLLAMLLEQLTPRIRAMLARVAERELAGWRDHETDAPPGVVPELLAQSDRIFSLAHRERKSTKRGAASAPLTVELVSK